MARRGSKNEMPFDVDAWRSDPLLDLLRPSSRDFWHEAILVMWKQGQTGVLSGQVVELAKHCRCSPAEARAAIDEIQARKVADVTECNGVVTLVNRRMKRDAEKRASVLRRVNKHRGKDPCNADCNADVTQDVTHLKHHDPPPDSFPSPNNPSSSLSPPEGSTREADGDPVKLLEGWELNGLGPRLSTPAVFRAIAEWFLFCREKGKAPTSRSWRMKLQDLHRWGPERTIAAIRYSIGQNYTGIIEPKEGGNGATSKPSRSAVAVREDN